MHVTIRPTKTEDYAAVNALGTASYPENYYEGDESFESKLRGYPDGCFVADLDGIVGYMISFPYLVGQPYPIDSMYRPVQGPDCYYIHDVCVMEEFRGNGIAHQLVAQALAKPWTVFGLVAVMRSSKFWRKFGFRSFASFNYYGRKAEYMIYIRD